MKLTTDLIMSLGPGHDWPRVEVEALLAIYGGEVEHAVLLQDPLVSAEAREDLGRLLLRGDAALLRFYACDCAEREIDRERAAGREPDPRSVAAVEVARRFAQGEATDAELAAARFAAWAAQPLSWSAARTAWPVAETAAELTARSAARSAADPDAEREWQVERLIAYLADVIGQESHGPTAGSSREESPEAGEYVAD